MTTQSFKVCVRVDGRCMVRFWVSDGGVGSASASTLFACWPKTQQTQLAKAGHTAV
jgi:hypothetical protein